jgi:hypothetical protein
MRFGITIFEIIDELITFQYKMGRKKMERLKRISLILRAVGTN